MRNSVEFENAHTSSYGSIQSDELRVADIEKLSDPTNASESSDAWYHGVSQRRLGSALALILTITILALTTNKHETTRFPTEITQSINASTGSERTSDSFAIHEKSEIPFPHIDRAEFGKKPIPPSTIVNSDLFSSSLLGDGGRFLKVPFPTGAFWTNLVTEPTSDHLLSYPVMAYPYGFKWNPDVLQISLPSLRRLMDKVSIRDIFNPDLTLTTVETVKQRYIDYFDPLSVTLRFQEAETAWWESYIVQGSPYVTARYENLTPVIRALSIFQGVSCLDSASNDSCTLLNNGDTEQDAGSHLVRLRGTQFVVQTMENLSWLVFSSEPTTIVFDTIGRTKLTTEGKFTGVIRLALLPPQQEGLKGYTSRFDQTYKGVLLEGDVPSGMKMIIKHSNVYPVGADVSWNFPSKDVGNLRFEFKTKSLSNKSRGDASLLMLALPHHVDVLSMNESKEFKLLKDKDDFDLTYRTIKGHMTPVLGSVWSYNEDLTTIGFDDKRALEMSADSSHRTKTTILDQVILDVKRVLPTLDENVYGYGKQVARLAQLIHIAKMLLDAADSPSITKKYSFIIEDSQAVLHDFLMAFLSGGTADPLVYDTNFGGLVTKDGLDDFMNDFGNGWYNDHHFHYGYYLYACAVMGQLDHTFVSEHGHLVDAVMYDVTHSSHASSDDRSGGAFFPLARHKAWFDGHSFASGLFRFASGKSMESSSESINCYYGAYLWSMVRGTSLVHLKNVDFTRLLLATEIRGIMTYWHMKPADNEDSPVAAGLFNPTFAANFMVGNLGMMDATVSTWFGNNPLYVHMINFMPVTAITRQLFEKSYIQKEFNNVIRPIYNTVEMAWKGYVVCDRAMLEPNKAWKDALELRSFELDQAVSQSQVLYFASTTEGFNDGGGGDDDEMESSYEEDYQGTDEDSGPITSARCIDHQACEALPLTGNCCPPSPGQPNLGCCDAVADTIPVQVPATILVNEANPLDSSVLCSENPKCAALNLDGFCCPAPNGAHLDCCN